MKFRKYEFVPSKWAELQAELQVSNTLGEETIADIIMRLSNR